MDNKDYTEISPVTSFVCHTKRKFIGVMSKHDLE